MACSYFDLDCQVYMVKVSYEQKPFRREVMRVYGASVTPSPSETTAVGRKILAAHPGTGGSLGCAISEAVEAAQSQEGYRYVLGSVLNQVLLHQTVIGLETKTALDKYNITPDIIIGCAGGGSNLGGLISPFMGEKLRGEKDYRFIAVEPASCPSLTRGKFVYDFCDTGMVCPLAKMYTPVSYTHLDVYKRQGDSRPEGDLFQIRRNRSEAGRNRIHYCETERYSGSSGIIQD